MAIKKIITIPNQILRAPTTLVDPFLVNQKSFKLLIEDLMDSMLSSDGIGIAATQIGSNLKVCIINTKDKPLVLINPAIAKFSWRKAIMEEGCLSVPGVWGLVKRSKKITVQTMNDKGEQKIFEAKDMFARVIQHEIDHLNGILFIDKTLKYTQGEPPKNS
ncbi:MAG: peptide deformylase [Patescibacteria group bacterium]|jgi:peptide deformylase